MTLYYLTGCGSSYVTREYRIWHLDGRHHAIGALPSHLNDEFHGFRWDIADPSEGWVHFYTSGGFAGHELVRYVSELGFGVHHLSTIEHQNEFDGVWWELPARRTVLLYDREAGGGGCLSLTGSGLRNLANTWFHDRISTLGILDGDYSADGANRSRPYDRNTYLAAHDSHVSDDHGWSRVWNQSLSMHDQLDYGARVLHLETLEDQGEFYLVQNDLNWTQVQRGGARAELLDAGLTRVERWLDDNPREVVTLIFQNRGGALGTDLKNQSRLRARLYLHEHGSWPTLHEPIASGRRVVVFESGTRSGEIPWLYDFAVENADTTWQNPAVHPGSDPIDELRRSLFVLNYLDSTPPSSWASTLTPNDLDSLRRLASNFRQLPNFVVVDRINAGGEGGADMARHCNFTLWPQRESRGGRAEFATFLPGCNGRELTATSHPILGRALDLTLRASSSSTAPSLGAGSLLLSASDRFWSGAALLPFAFAAPDGMICSLRVAPEVSIGFQAAGTDARFSIVLPNQPELQGTEIYLQSADFGGGRLSLSQLGRARVGAR